MGVKTFYIGKSLEDPKRATVMFQGPVNTCYDIFVLGAGISMNIYFFLEERNESTNYSMIN